MGTFSRSQFDRVVLEEGKGTEWSVGRNICGLLKAGTHFEHFTLGGMIEERKINKLSKFEIARTFLLCSDDHILKNLNFGTLERHSELIHAIEVIQTPNFDCHVLGGTQYLLWTVFVFYERGNPTIV